MQSSEQVSTLRRRSHKRLGSGQSQLMRATRPCGDWPFSIEQLKIITITISSKRTASDYPETESLKTCGPREVGPGVMSCTRKRCTEGTRTTTEPMTHCSRVEGLERPRRRISFQCRATSHGTSTNRGHQQFGNFLLPLIVVVIALMFAGKSGKEWDKRENNNSNIKFGMSEVSSVGRRRE